MIGSQLYTQDKEKEFCDKCAELIEKGTLGQPLVCKSVEMQKASSPVQESQTDIRNRIRAHIVVSPPGHPDQHFYVTAKVNEKDTPKIVAGRLLRNAIDMALSKVVSKQRGQ